ncbi:MAG: two-component regulator propeller domain-containing protein [Dysgonamonadaceae bacterium]
MKRHLRLSLVIYVLNLFFGTAAYAIDLNFKTYLVENGLSSNTIYSALQDTKGFMWFGTEDGLNRFNGYEFKTFRNIPRDTTSLSNNYVYCLLEDNSRTLWVGTERGVCTYNPQTNKFKAFRLKAQDGTSIHDRIQNMVADEKGNIWIASYRQGIFFYNRKANSLKRYSFSTYTDPLQSPDLITYLYKDKDNTIWTSVNSTVYQIYRLDKNSDRFVPAFPHIASGELKKLSSYSIIEDTFGTLWFGTWNNGLYEVDKVKGIVNRYLNQHADKIVHIHTITEYEPGNLLIGSDDGLTSFTVSPIIGNRRAFHLREPDVSSRFIYPIYQDREGGLWIGTYYGGINYAAPSRNYFAGYTHDPHKNSVSGNVISSFCEDESGNLWIGTDDGGLNYMDKASGIFSSYKPQKGRNSISFHNIHGLCLDGKKLWIGTYTGGLNVMDLTTGQFRCYKNKPNDSTSIDGNSIFSLYRDSRHNIWIGTTQGINLYNRQTDNFNRIRKLSAVTIDMIEYNKTLWFATIGNGLHVYDPATHRWTNYVFEAKNKNSLNSNEVLCLCVDDNNQLWIGTNSGLCKFNPKERNFSPVPLSTQSNTIYKIISDKEFLWMTTSKGLIRFDSQRNQLRTFTKSDGLLSDLFIQNSGIKTSSGRIYIGTANGFNAFYPKQIITNRYIPPVLLTDFQIFNKSVDNPEEYMSVSADSILQLTLPYSKNVFSLEYAALSYFAPEKNEYTFMLEGFDKDWNYVGNQRRTTYTNLSPGEYTFRVKASNNDGIWNDAGLTMKIVITPPFWRTHIAIVLYVILYSVTMLLLLKYMWNVNARKNRIRMEKIRIAHEKEIHEAKINFFTTIAHEIRTPVSLIIAPLEKIIETANQFPPKIKSDLDIIDRNAQRLLSLVNQLLDFRKIEQESVQMSYAACNIDEVLANICDRFRPSLEQRGIKLEYCRDVKDFNAVTDVENLTKVISNLLNNASKFTHNHIGVYLARQDDNETFSIKVVDNGTGIPKEYQQKIFNLFFQVPDNPQSGTGIGLNLVKRIVDALGGTIEVNSIENQKTEFIIVIPTYRSPEEKNCLPPVDLVEQIGLNPVHKADWKNKYIEKEASKTKATLLIVEDNTDIQEFLWKNLSETYHILLADNGEEGLQVLAEHEINLIISDIMMPKIDGIEFCSRIKKNLLWSHIPVVLLTAKNNTTTKIEAMENGADVYIEKPFSIRFLAAQIKNLLSMIDAMQKKYAEAPFIPLNSIARNKTDKDFLSKVNEVIERNISNERFSMDDLAEELCISNSGLFAKIKNLSGCTPNKLLLLMRLKKAAELLRHDTYRINEICYRVGFSNPSYFAKCFHKQFGVLPKDFRNNQSETPP